MSQRRVPSLLSSLSSYRLSTSSAGYLCAWIGIGFLFELALYLFKSLFILLDALLMVLNFLGEQLLLGSIHLE